MDMESYKKHELIGQGTFGAVFLAVNPKGEKLVFKEIVLAGYSEKEISKKLKEASLLSSLKHPNIVKYRHHKIKDDILTIAMEYAEDGNLKNFINTRPEKLEEDLMLRIFTQIILAVNYIHEQNIVHRDICAENVLLKKRFQVKLSDFGISKQDGGSSGISSGHLSYFAPELCRGKKHSRETDMWAVGCLLFLLATLELPFNSPTIAGLLRAILVTPPSLTTGKYSFQLQGLIDALLAKNPYLRLTAKNLLSHQYLAYHVHLNCFRPI
ncbi:serine/threonine-protein kinase nekl-2-like [Cimex lectularius]|uniref:non-specific serine/threonine protein kinase n=1 Tax=Cimex lectularius TaxID=79782 RepID=A0A8I6RUN4_CIMLE|nr:serine/threonine-protein kinase nekl-2-like [Cimex lectularius]